ncbi:MAG: hypothetical protein JW809_17630 [Pirellulales bacterium]|nr:hypothetical protein [Pirellulales bacterium]
MQRATSIRGGIGAALCATAMLCSVAGGYTTTSPEVVGMISRALPYLEAAGDSRPGGMAVIGLALVKARVPLDHPKLKEVVETIQAVVADSPDPTKMNLDVYSNGLCIIFLVAYDPDTYANEIRALLASLAAKQKPHGGWGYPELDTGDTSMTQYGALSTWEAKQVGFAIPQKSVERVADWLVRTQDPSGAWGYQGKTSPNYQPVAQEGVRPSMTAAGLGSTYICADLLGFMPEAVDRNNAPALALREVSRKEASPIQRREQVQTAFNPELLRNAQKRGNNWLTDRPPVDQRTHGYTLYYLYALERCQSFRELAEGRADRDPAKEEGPVWYNDGVDWLRANQRQDGTWEAGCSQPIDTSFAVLFLLRSMHHSIQRARGFGDGLLVGGRGLPTDGNLVTVEDGKVVSKPKQSPFEALRAAMDRDDSDAEALAAAAARIDQMPAKESRLLVSEFRRKIETLLANPDAEKRAAAVKMLARGGDVDNVPLLILALEDPDLDVVLTARDGLCRLTRKFEGFGPSDNPTDLERARAVAKWRAWYLSIRPDAEF